MKEAKKKAELTEEKKIEKLASYGLTNKEISEALGYDENTLKRNFEIFLTKGRANLKRRLRRKQLEVAFKGNVSMLIWLGKQYLAQADKLEENGEYEIVVTRKTIGNPSDITQEYVCLPLLRGDELRM